MLVSSQNSYVEILTPKVMVLGGGGFGRWLGNEDRALMIGISARTKKTTGTSLAVQWLRRCASTAGGTGSIPGSGN